MAQQGDPILRCCLAAIDCAQYMDVFIENEIDFDCFKSLSKEELGTLLTGKIGPLKKISTEIERIRAIDGGTIQVTSMTATLATPISPVQKSQTQGTQSDAGIAPKESIKSVQTLNSKATEVGTMKASGLKSPTTAGIAIGTQTKPVDESLLSKYGFQLPSAGAFITSIAVGTVQKHIIDNYTHPFAFGESGATTPAPGTGTGNDTGNGGTGGTEGGGTGTGGTGTGGTETGGTGTGGTGTGGIGAKSMPNQEGNDPAMNEYLSKYGNPKDPNATGRSMVQPKDETADMTINDETEVDYSTADAQDFQDVGAVDGDFGVVDDTLTDVGTEEGGLIDLIGGIVGMFTSGGDQV